MTIDALVSNEMTQAIVETVQFQGRTYRRYPNSPHRNHRVYFQFHATAGTPLYLHREIWKSINGEIPEGGIIHHVDSNPLNNDPSNLKCVMSVREHAAEHDDTWGGKSDRRKQLRHLETIRPMTLEWHASEEGLEWHRQNGYKTWDGRKYMQMVCQVCGEEYESPYPTRSRFCSRNCIARNWRREKKAQA